LPKKGNNERESGKTEVLLESLRKYFIEMDTIKIETSDTMPEQAANLIYRHIYPMV
jgi:hypothetical protein